MDGEGEEMGMGSARQRTREMEATGLDRGPGEEMPHCIT